MVERKLDAYRTEPGAQPLEKRQKWNRIPLVEAMRLWAGEHRKPKKKYNVARAENGSERQKRGENYMSLLTDLPS